MTTLIKQQTLKSSFSLEGKGLHSGVHTKITFSPAPENHGYKIMRTDLKDTPVIDALAENVIDTERCTVLGSNGVQVATVEHAMAALYACEIDNCLIEIDSPEFPILDGSAIQYIKQLKEVGTQIQDAERIYLDFPRKKFKISDPQTGASMQLIPSQDSYTIQCEISFNSPLLRKQSASLENLREFAREIASARTFVFVREIQYLLQNDLIKGGDLDNSIVIYDSVLSQEEYNKIADIVGVGYRDAGKLGYIMNRPLLFSNEPARHKLLDIMGDLALAGGFIKGRVVANRPGHKINNQLARAIREYYIESIKDKEMKKRDKKYAMTASPA
ncbi:UDP-3-O-acyl-N-acetylglucosamine deacetylase [Dysgonomonas macrotermitis]|uniref:UDP-3-O-acyl-N-acetylglucosamine deacetylase n=1 Tax=Dysgonomonas macrotermitis TaxID=1346286 RepID=A0A1M4STH5_9BACT|nr:UDP-3-O-acyl-N-acetylglucosamine deacetylase [Dysgonomonas macrotermitis]SHE35491.1 UDP-3-O-[3-hydroxymyristoyl] N-acetylglucosamine deacetylase [Dysgonomonas macrotermitis]